MDDYHNTANLSTRFQYKSETIGSGDEITVKVPYSVYQTWDNGKAFNAIAEVAKNAEGKDANAKIFISSRTSGKYTEFLSYDPTDTDSTKVYKRGKK